MLLCLAITLPNAAYKEKAISMCWSAPAAKAPACGQVVEIVVVMSGLSLWACRKRLLFFSGLLLALCTIKYTLAAVVPLAIIVGREWKVLWGFVVGCSILTAISFILQGFDCAPDGDRIGN